MTVYLVPLGPLRYTLYSESRAAATEDAPSASGLKGRILAAFRRAVDEGDRDGSAADPPPESGRLRRFVVRKIAEVVAEQRLLWAVRHESRVTLLHPDTMSGAQAVSVARAEFGRDYLRHRRWLCIDALLVLITGPALFFVPGPNLVSWYFTFRAVGHYFSMRGARQGLIKDFFLPERSTALSEVGAALNLPPGARDSALDRASAALGLERLPAFVVRVCSQRP